MTRHPKFQALLTCLADAAQQRDSWHAIVFARTREAVRTLAALLQGRPELPGMQVSGREGGLVSNARIDELSRLHACRSAYTGGLHRHIVVHSPHACCSKHSFLCLHSLPSRCTR